MENIDTRLEEKLGFGRVREAIAARCSTDYAVRRAQSERFSTSEREIRKRLIITDEMRLVMMFEENFPQSGYIDCIEFLKPLERESTAIDLLSLRKLKTMTETLRKVTGFFEGIKDGVYPSLKKMSSQVAVFPEVQRRIDLILDRYGEIRDTASDNLFEIRKSLREK